MSSEGKPSFNPLSGIGKLFNWLVSQFDDGILIGLSILGAGLLVIGGMFVLGHLTPKTPVVNKQQIFQNSYGYNSDFTHSYDVSQAAQTYQHQPAANLHLSYPKNTYHRSHHVQSYYHHVPSHNQVTGNYQHYNRHMASSQVVSPQAHHYSSAAVGHRSANSPYSVHRFGKPRGDREYNSKSYHFFNAGGAHAAH